MLHIGHPIYILDVSLLRCRLCRTHPIDNSQRLMDCNVAPSGGLLLERVPVPSYYNDFDESVFYLLRKPAFRVNFDA